MTSIFVFRKNKKSLIVKPRSSFLRSEVENQCRILHENDEEIYLDYGKESVRIHSYSGFYKTDDEEHPPHKVLRNDYPQTKNVFWAGRDGEQDWIILDLGKELFFDAVQLANACPGYHCQTKEFK